jgi:hypothetical protein
MRSNSVTTFEPTDPDTKYVRDGLPRRGVLDHGRVMVDVHCGSGVRGVTNRRNSDDEPIEAQQGGPR